MVSGFLTSPWDHWRMSSAVARPIRSSSKTLTSSKVPTFYVCKSGGWCMGIRISGGAAWHRRRAGLDLFDRGRLAPGQVDAEFLGGPEDVVVGVTHLDGDPVAGEHLDVQA